MSGHALLSASSSHKWLNCTPSARFEEQFEDTTSDHAREGTLAHEIGELKLRKAYIDPMGLSVFNRRLAELQKRPLYQDEMLTHTDTYLDYISKIVYSLSKKPQVIRAEMRVDYNSYVKEGFGTADNVIIGDGTLYVNDFKYGKGVEVSADHNPQMMLYALGVYAEYSFLYDITKVRMTIIQPRKDNLSVFEMPIEDLLAWGESIKPKADLAYKGEGEFNPGEWCIFCRARHNCRAKTELCVAVINSFGSQKPPGITNDEVGAILTNIKARDIKKWITDLEEYALAECLSGGTILGWKAVQGRSDRAFTDTDKAFNTLISAGYNESMLYERKPLTLAAIEKVVGKKEFAQILADLIIKPPGRPTLVMTDDKREAISNKPSLVDDFGVPLGGG